jgi:ADP-ribose pyrophosphatase
MLGTVLTKDLRKPAAASFDRVERLIEEDPIPDLRSRGCIWLAQLRVLQKSAHDRLAPVG